MEREKTTENMDGMKPLSGTASKHEGHRFFKSGFVGIIGRPNAGKSTLFNRLLGRKLSIITPKAQTTRHRIRGFYTESDVQIVFLDTPGIIQPAYLLQRRMMDQVKRLRLDADMLLHLVDAAEPFHRSDVVWETLRELSLPTLLLVNKTDLLSSGDEINRVLKSGESFYPYVASLAISARTGMGLDRLMKMIREYLPEGPAFFPDDEATDLPVRFFVSELIREQIFLLYQEEIPYSCAVNIARYEEDDQIDRIYAEIVVNRESQKGILIGRGGSMLKKLGISSRKSIESFLGKKAHLDLFVKVRDKWREKDTYLREYGYR